MAIRVSLYPNHLAKDGSQFVRIVAPRRLSFERLLDYMVKDTALEKNDMRSVLEQFRDSVCTYLKLGYRVESPIGSFHPGIANGLVRVNGHVAPITNAGLRVNFVPDSRMVSECRDGAEVATEDFGGYVKPILIHMSNVDTAVLILP